LFNVHRDRIHIAEMPEYTLNIWGGLMDNGAVVRGWNGAKEENDKWYLKDFADHTEIAGVRVTGATVRQ
jgi:hypothetical protein